MLNRVELIGRVQHPIPGQAGPNSGYSFTIWVGILVRVSVPREMGPRLRDVLQRRTMIQVEGELCRGGSVWARRVMVMADAKPRHVGLVVQTPLPRAETALASEFTLPDRPRTETVEDVFPEATGRVLCLFHGERCPGPPNCPGA